MRSRLLAASISMSFAVGLFACASQNQPPAKPGIASVPMTPQLKKDMADMYQKMAECLRTDKSLEQCSRDAMKNCPVVEKTGHCPINEGMGHTM